MHPSGARSCGRGTPTVAGPWRTQASEGSFAGLRGSSGGLGRPPDWRLLVRQAPAGPCQHGW
eukprot:14648079-Alexandrium_andersonii.AAC.1